MIPQSFPLNLRIRKGGGSSAGEPGRADERSARERNALLRVAAAAAGANDIESVLELAAEEALRAIGGASLSISRVEGDGEGHYRTLINVGQLGPGEERFPAEEIYEIERFPMLKRMVQTGKPYFNSLDDPDCDSAAASILRSLGKSSDLGVPIEVEGENWGEVWATTTAATTPFRSEDVRFLEAIAGQLAGAIARAELFSKVSRLAYEDPLTGLANRRALDERLERAMGRFHTEGTSLALLLCDLDRLKAINDAGGHVAGDHALKAVAQNLVAAAAELPGAFVARLGGDEFCILLESRQPGALEQVGATAQRLLAAGELDVSLSCGAATAGPGVASATQLLRAADAAQYVAKRRGGNRVCTAAHVAEELDTAEALAIPIGPLEERIAAATESLVRRLDDELADAPTLDRLEAVATTYTEVADFARWAISLAASGRTYLRDISLGENRRRHSFGARVTQDPEEYRQYKLDDFPATARIVAAGSGSFVARVAEEGDDPAERDLLEQEGFVGLVAAAVGDADGVYLIELVADDPQAPFAQVEPALNIAVRAAVQAPPHRRSSRPLSSAHSRALELSLALADELAEATTEEGVCEAAATTVQAAFDCPVVHLVALCDTHLEMRAERAPRPTPANWAQRADAGLIGRCLLEGEPVLSGEVGREPQYRATDATRDVRSELAVPIFVAGSPWGAINLEHTEVEAFTVDDSRLLEAVAAQIGGALNAIELYESLDRAYLGTAEALSAALEAKDSYTAEHSRSIAAHAVAVGRRMGMEAEELRMLRYAAAFHDIGKLAIPREILNKPGPLEGEERGKIEHHTLIGERILEPIELLEPIRPIVRSAHERWDGSGYPDGLAGEEIPLGARILLACDAYDAMTTDRPYRAALPESAAKAELREGSGTQFDPTIVDVLLAVLEADVRAAAAAEGVSGEARLSSRSRSDR